VKAFAPKMTTSHFFAVTSGGKKLTQFSFAADIHFFQQITHMGVNGIGGDDHHTRDFPIDVTQTSQAGKFQSPREEKMKRTSNQLFL
jgi:hypothetical protein